jgi:hypothetical protein
MDKYYNKVDEDTARAVFLEFFNSVLFAVDFASRNTANPPAHQNESTARQGLPFPVYQKTLS